MKLAAIVVAALAVLAFAGAVQAATPTLLSVGHEDRHPVATFTMPGVDSARIYFATKPDRATDGRFLDENVKNIDFLTTDEIQGGRWLDGSQLDPGTYYVLLNATDYECSENPNCIDGFSKMVSMTIPKPAQRYSRRAKAYRYLSTVDLTFTVTPLGEALPYEVCWTRTGKPRKCVVGTVDGYSWNSAATDTIEVRKRGMRKLTTFTWYVDGRKVASQRVRIP